MDTDRHGFHLPAGELTHQIIGCAFEVLNDLGPGLHEKPYENALTVEFGLLGIDFEQQRRFEVRYKTVPVGEFIPDLVVGNSVVVDTKTIERISDIERGQMLNYLRITQIKVGLIINFKRPKIEWERVIL